MSQCVEVKETKYMKFSKTLGFNAILIKGWRSLEDVAAD